MTAVGTTALTVGRWEHVSSLTSVRFAVRNFGVMKVQGTLPVLDAAVDVDPAGTPQRVRATLDLAAIDTHNRKRDADLLKPNLLDTAHHPHLAFTGTPRPTGDGWEIAGHAIGRASTDLTLHAEVIRRDASGRLTVRATTAVDRRALGVRAPRFLIGRLVEVALEATFHPPT